MKGSVEESKGGGGINSFMSKTMVAWKLFYVFMGLTAVSYG